MLRGWPIALVAATGASGLFAFGVLQSAFTQQAQALFIVFAAVLILFVGGKKLTGGGGHGGHAAHGHGGGDHAVVMSGKMVGTITMTVGTIFLMWIGEQIDAFGIGNGISLLIMAGILARMPAAMWQLLGPVFKEGPQLGGTSSRIGVETLLVLIVLFVGVVFGVVFITHNVHHALPIV